MAQITTWKDFLNLTDDADIKAAIEQIQKLNKEYSSLSKNLKKQNQHINKAIKDVSEETNTLTTNTSKLTKEQKNQSAQLAKQAKATDEVFKKAKALSQAKENAAKLEKLYGRSVETLNAQLKAQTLEFRQLDSATENGAKRIKELGLGTRKLKGEIKDLTDVTKKQNNVFEQTEKSYDSLTRANNKLKAELRGLPNSFDKTNKKAKELKEQIGKNTQELKEFDKAIGDNFRNVGNYGSALDGLSGKLGGLSGNGIGGVISGLGSMIPQLAVAGAAIGAVAAGVNELNQLAKELRVQFKAVSDTLGLIGEEAEQATVGIRATSKTFDQDFNEVLRASNTLMESFGLSAEDALKVIDTGFITGANSSEEMLDSIKEYPVFFRDAGMNATHLMAVIKASADKGVFSDKGVDAVKEFNIRITEMTKATKDALVPLGSLRNEQIQAAVESGNAGEALKIVTQGMADAGLSAQQLATITADVFGGPGEDLGKDFLINLGKVLVESEKGEAALTKYQKKQLETLETNRDFEESLVDLGSRFTDLSHEGETLWTRIKTFGVDALLFILNLFEPLVVAVSDLWKSLINVGEGFGFINTVTKTASIIFDILKFAVKAIVFQISNMIKALTWAIGLFNEYIVQSKPVQAVARKIAEAFEFLVDKIKEVPKVMNGLINAFKVGFAELKGLILEQGQIISDAFVAIFDPRKSVKDVLARSSKAVRNYGAKIKKAFLDGYNATEVKKVISESTTPEIKTAATKKGAKKAGVTGISGIEEKEDELKRIQEAVDNFDKKRLSRLKLAIKKRLDLNKTEANLMQAELQKQYNSGLIDKETFEKTKAEIQEKYSGISLANEKAALENIVDLNVATADELILINKRLSEIQLAQNEVKTEEIEENEKDLFDKIVEFGEKALEAAFDFATKITERNIADSEFKLERLEAERARDIELAGNNEAQKKIINDKAEADREQLEAKRRAALTKQAKLEKAAAITSTIINTARGVAAALPVIPLAILVGAMGAAQIATIAAQPLPQFYKGTDSSPEGFAHVGERGRELMVTPDGSLEYAMSPQVKYLEKGTKVIEHDKTKQIEEMLFGNNVNNEQSLASITTTPDQSKELVRAVEKGNKEMLKAVKGMERFSFEGTNKGIRAFAINSRGRTELLNERYG